jgi:hypothetical protein
MLMSPRKRIYIYSASISLALPRTLVLAALPPPLRSAVPLCAQSCVEDFVQIDYSTSVCPDKNNFDCLCSHYGVDGYALGEGVYACLYSSNCPLSTRTNNTSLYFICAGRADAVTPTYKTIIATITPSAKTSSLSSSSSITSAQPTMTTSSSAGGSVAPNSDSQPSASPQSVVSMNVSLTMAQIAGITIAAAAVLILTVGIATCLIFVRRNRRMQDLDDHKILLYPSPKPPGSQGSQFAQQAQDSRGGTDKRQLPPPPEPPIEVPAWPRYYPIMPDDIGVATTANYPLQVPVKAPSKPNPQYPARYFAPPPLERQSTGVILPQPPVPAHTEPPKTTSTTSKQSKRVSIFRPTSAMTEFEEDNPLSPARSTFGALQPSNQPPNNGPQRRQEVDILPFQSPPPSNKPRPPPLTLQIPTFEQTLPPPPPNPPKQKQQVYQQPHPRPLLLRENQSTPDSLRIGLASRPQFDPRNSSHSSAIASSQALRFDSFDTPAEQLSSRSNRPPSKNGRDSQASMTSFESSEDEDEEPTPPKEEDKRLSTVQESAYSPASFVTYPKVPRAANQVVPRTPASPASPGKQASVQAEAGGRSPSQSSPRRNQTPTAVSQSIGNRLWKTELSPKNKKPQYPTWNDRQGQESWSWAGEQSLVAASVSPGWSTPVQQPSTPHQQGRTTPVPQTQPQTPPNYIPMPPNSPFGIGVMPRLTPTRRGDDLFLSVNR